jgi:hypothetical protein
MRTAAPGLSTLVDRLDHLRIPSLVEISRVRIGFHGDTVANLVRIRGWAQRLMNIANKTNRKCQVTVGTPFIMERLNSFPP